MNLKTYTFLALTLLLILSCSNNNANESLLQEIIELQIQNDSLMEIVMEKEEHLNSSKTPQWFYPETDARKLLESGIENPEAYIKNALLEKTDLIPMDAVLGGTMHYNNIQLLGDQWLIADFEDGHVYGKVIVKYTIGENNEVAFKIIALSDN